MKINGKGGKSNCPHNVQLHIAIAILVKNKIQNAFSKASLSLYNCVLEDLGISSLGIRLTYIRHNPSRMTWV
jgi:hypothetical protein